MRANANKRRQTLTNASKRRGENVSKRRQTRANVDKRKQTLTPPFIAVFYTPLGNPLKDVSDSRRASSLRTHPHKRVTMIMIGFFKTEATIKIKHSRRGTHSNGKIHMFLGATVADGKTAAKHWENRRAPNPPESNLHRMTPFPSFPWCFCFLGVFLAARFLGLSECFLLIFH